jgi:transcription initiation factor IIE alpha subunit
MNMTPKEVHKFLAPLISDSILQQHSKAEPKTPQEIERGRLGVQEGQERKPRQRVFYFVDYRTAVDGVKWRMVQLTTLLSKDSQTHESQYVCPRCGRRYSTFDAASLLSPDLMSFQCLDCGSTLQEETNSGVDENGEEKAKYARLMQQVDPIVRAMKAVDDIHVPENTFNIALANAIPPFDDVDTSVDYPNLAPTHAVVRTTYKLQPRRDRPSKSTFQKFKRDHLQKILRNVRLSSNRMLCLCGTRRVPSRGNPHMLDLDRQKYNPIMYPRSRVLSKMNARIRKRSRQMQRMMEWKIR